MPSESGWVILGTIIVALIGTAGTIYATRSKARSTEFDTLARAYQVLSTELTKRIDLGAKLERERDEARAEIESVIEAKEIALAKLRADKDKEIAELRFQLFQSMQSRSLSNVKDEKSGTVPKGDEDDKR